MSTEAPKLTKEDFARDVLIQDEAELAKISDAVQIDKMITTPIIEENHFLDEKLIDDISGNDYKEVVNQNAREWIIKTSTTPANANAQAILTVDDALKEVEKEKEKSKETKAQIVEMVAAGRKRGKTTRKTIWTETIRRTICTAVPDRVPAFRYRFTSAAWEKNSMPQAPGRPPREKGG